MKLFYTLSFILLFNLVNAQTLTYTAFSNILTQTENLVIASAPSSMIGLTTMTGTGVTWNASSLTQAPGTPVVHMTFVDPATTPNGQLYPNSNYANYDPALASFIGVQYFQINSDSMVSWGSYEPSTSHEIFQDADKYLIFPFSYGQSFSDNYAKTNYSDANTISSYQTGVRMVAFNGHGTLILPQGTFTNVGMFSELRTNSLGPNSTRFTWFDLTTGKRLMMYSENNGNEVGVYSTDAPTSVIGLEQSDVMIFPNPASMAIKLLGAQRFENYSIYNTVGMSVQSGEINNATIPTHLLAKGVYFVNLISASGQVTRSFVIK